MKITKLLLIAVVLGSVSLQSKANDEDKWQDYVTDMTTRTYFWCRRVDPSMVDYCTDEVSDCVLDEGKDFENWCRKDYCDTEDLIYVP